MIAATNGAGVPVDDTQTGAMALEVAGLHPLLARVYRGRGVASADELELDLSRLIPPAKLTHADRAAVLLADAI